jgi:hypothetical protein
MAQQGGGGARGSFADGAVAASEILKDVMAPAVARLLMQQKIQLRMAVGAYRSSGMTAEAEEAERLAAEVARFEAAGGLTTFAEGMERAVSKLAGGSLNLQPERTQR